MSRHIVTALLLFACTTAVHAQTEPDAQSATQAPDATNAGDAQSASGARNAPAKSGAAAKRPAQAAPKAGDDATKANGEGGSKDEVKTLSGISILGNQEAPKSLVIVPWKSSEIGDMPGLSRLLDDSVQPIDKEVFMRELDYYEIRSSSR
jgi:hypothetical protein